MDKISIDLKFQNAIDKMSRMMKSDKKSLNDMKDEYKETINLIDDIIDSLQYYKKEPENLYNEYTNELSTSLIDKKKNKLPKGVKVVYNEFGNEYPLLTGEEDKFCFRSKSSRRIDGKNEFIKKAKKHIQFLKEIRRVFRRAIDEIEKSSEKMDRIEYKKKASKQRDKNYSSDESIMPDMTPEKVREELLETLDENKPDDQKEEDKEDDDSNMKLMTQREFIHFIIEHISKLSDRSEQYKFIKSAHPKQCEVIDNNIHGLNSLRNIDYNKDGLFKLNEIEMSYIEYRVKNDKHMTLEYYKEEIYQSGRY